MLTEPTEPTRDFRHQIVGNRGSFKRPTDPRAELTDALPVLRLQARQPTEAIVEPRHFRHDPLKGFSRNAKPQPAHGFFMHPNLSLVLVFCNR